VDATHEQHSDTNAMRASFLFFSLCMLSLRGIRFRKSFEKGAGIRQHQRGKFNGGREQIENGSRHSHAVRNNHHRLTVKKTAARCYTMKSPGKGLERVSSLKEKKQKKNTA